RQQFAFQGLVGVEHVVDRLDAGGLLEVLQRGLADVVAPVVDVHGGCGLGHTRYAEAYRYGGQGFADGDSHTSVLILVDLLSHLHGPGVALEIRCPSLTPMPFSGQPPAHGAVWGSCVTSAGSGHRKPPAGLRREHPPEGCRCWLTCRT